MCSCLTSFPGFFRYHLPFFKSILSFVNSSFRSLHLAKAQNRSSDPSDTPSSKSGNTKRLAKQNVEVTLGSRVDGRGHFLNPASVFATEPDWLPLSEAARNSPMAADHAPDATHREYYEEMAEQQQSRVRNPPSPHNHHPQGSRSRSTSDTVAEVELPTKERAPKTKLSSVSGSASWNKIHQQSSTPRTGYWDLISFFRTDSAIYRKTSKMRSGSNFSAV